MGFQDFISDTVDTIKGTNPQWMVFSKSEQPIADAQGQLLDFNVVNCINRIPTAYITLYDGQGEDGFALSSKEAFQVGSFIEIKAGQGALDQSLFKGIIVKQGLKSRKNQPSILCLELKDEAIKLTVARKSKIFTDQKEEALLKKIVSEHSGIKIKFDDEFGAETTTHPEMVQYHVTDWDFIVNRAEKVGRVVTVNNGTITLEKPKLFAPAPKALRFTYPGSVYEFETQMDARYQFDTYEPVAINYDGKELIGDASALPPAPPAIQEDGTVASGADETDTSSDSEEEAGGRLGRLIRQAEDRVAKLEKDIKSEVTDIRKEVNGEGNKIKQSINKALNGNIAAGPTEVDVDEQGSPKRTALAGVLGFGTYTHLHPGPVDKEELDALARGGITKSKFGRMCGRIRVEGLGEVVPGNTVELTGAGRNFDGYLYVAGVRHVFTTDAWETDIEFGLAHKWFSERPDVAAEPASGLVAPTHGMMLGEVTEYGEDPKSQYRIKVRIPAIPEGNDGIWARLAQPQAGAGYGLYSLPEVGDQVVLAFFNDDPRDPVIIGSLHHKNAAAADDADFTDANTIKGFITKAGIKVLLKDEEEAVEISTPEGQLVELTKEKVLISLNDNDFISVEKGNISLTSTGGEINLDADTININATKELNLNGGDVTASATGPAGTATLKGFNVKLEN